MRALLKKSSIGHAQVSKRHNTRSPVEPCLAFVWRPCGVAWDAVPEPSWLLKLRRTPALKFRMSFAQQTMSSAVRQYNPCNLKLTIVVGQTSSLRCAYFSPSPLLLRCWHIIYFSKVETSLCFYTVAVLFLFVFSFIVRWSPILFALSVLRPPLFLLIELCALSSVNHLYAFYLGKILHNL